MTKFKATNPINFKGAHEMPYCTVSTGLMTWNKTGSWRYLRPSYVEKIPACQASCPAGEPIERWISELEKGDSKKAWEILTTENPFPGLMGRVCFHPCEKGCNRKDVGGSVTINMLERFLADSHGYENTSVKSWKNSSGKKVAVIGSGPAGLSASYFLARMGHSVTVYERFPKPGGLFRYGIPEYRLPKKVLENELLKLNSLGVSFKCGTKLSKEEIVELAEKNDAVFVSIGAHVSRPLGVEGDKSIGVQPALEFLEEAQMDLESKGLNREKLKNKKVAVIGGGNSAVDAARTAVRLGAKSVTIIYRRSRVEMPAFEEEINEAEKEGVKIELLAAPNRVISENGHLKSLECIKMELGAPDSSGRRKPEPIQGSEYKFEADLVLAAIGEVVDETITPPKGNKIFSGGDMIEQPRTAVNAIGSGKYSAIEIDCLLSGRNFSETLEKIKIPETNYVKMALYLKLLGIDNPAVPLHINTSYRQKVVKTEDLNTYYFDNSKPSEYPKIDIGARISQNPMAEILQSPAKELVASQIARCMHCGRCTECDNCFIYCPDVAIDKISDGFDINMDFCKGCGVCVKECPRAAMEMGEEPTF